MKYIFVHDSWHNASHWKPLADILVRKGQSVVAVDLPGHGKHLKKPETVTYDDYYTLLENIILQSSEPITLVAHSTTASIAASLFDHWSGHIAHFYLISGLVPQNGQSVMDLIQGSTAFSSLENDETKNLYKISHTLASELFYDDCSPEVHSWVASSRHQGPLDPLKEPIDLINRDQNSEKRSYILCEASKAIPLSLQREILKNYPCREIVVSAGYCPFLSMPATIAEIFLSSLRK